MQFFLSYKKSERSQFIIEAFRSECSSYLPLSLRDILILAFVKRGFTFSTK